MIGISNFSAADMMRAGELLGTRLASNQLEYNLFERSIEHDIIPLCEAHGISVIAYNPLHLSRTARHLIGRISEKYGLSPAQISLSWLILRPNVIAIPRTSSLAHTRENAAASDVALLPEDVAAIDVATRRVSVEVPVAQIRVAPSEHEPVYTTLKEAIENRHGLTPSPAELAKNILEEGNFLKPVRLAPSTDDSGSYNLTQGRIRYWAWVIAYGEQSSITALIDDD
jgi:hypothetical protein